MAPLVEMDGFNNDRGKSFARPGFLKLYFILCQRNVVFEVLAVDFDFFDGF